VHDDAQFPISHVITLSLYFKFRFVTWSLLSPSFPPLSIYSTLSQGVHNFSFVSHVELSSLIPFAAFFPYVLYPFASFEFIRILSCSPLWLCVANDQIDPTNSRCQFFWRSRSDSCLVPCLIMHSFVISRSFTFSLYSNFSHCHNFSFDSNLQFPDVFQVLSRFPCFLFPFALFACF